jgi:hypothetical protein
MVRSFVFFLWVCALGAVPLVGCGENTGTGGSGGAGAAGGGGTGGGGTFEAAVAATESPGFVSFAESFGGPPLEGVELCETDTTNCATTDVDGLASIMLPANQEVSLTLEKEGYVPYLIPGIAAADAVITTPFPMLSDQLGEDLSDIMTTPYPWTGGVIALTAFPARRA